MKIDQTPTYSKALTTRSGRLFVGRHDLLKTFRDTLKEHHKAVQNNSNSEIQPRVLNFHGLSGIGKSALILQLRASAVSVHHAAVVAGVEFTPGDRHEADLHLRTIRREAKQKHNVDCPNFDIASAIYWKTARPDYVLQQSDFKYWDEAGLAADLIKAFEDAPLAQWIVKVPKAARNLSKACRRWLIERRHPALARLPYLEKEQILNLLPSFLAADFRNHQANAEVETPLVLYLDGYESLLGDSRKLSDRYHHDDWVRELIKSLPSALFVISGQEKISWAEKWPEWKKIISVHELQKLPDKLVEQFLTSSGIKEPEILERIKTASTGVPFYLEISVDSYERIIARGEKPNANAFGGTYDDIFKRFLRNLTEDEQSVLKVLSAPRH